MPGAIHNYWLGIMALSFALALTVWIGLVFYADKHPGGQAQESWPRREVMGGSFTAKEGGRQVTPDPNESPEPDDVPPLTPPAPTPPAPTPPAPRQPVPAEQGERAESGPGAD